MNKMELHEVLDTLECLFVHGLMGIEYCTSDVTRLNPNPSGLTW